MSGALTDWTEVWVQTSQLSAGEGILSVILLSATVIIEFISFVLHHYSDSVTPINTSIVSTPPSLFDQTFKFGYNYPPNFVTLSLASKPGRPRVHYVDVGPRDTGRVVLLVHGEPFWSFAWAKVIPGLSRDSRVIVPDLVGFGRSDKYVDWRLYDLELHVDTLGLLLDRLGVGGAGEEVTLVGHNWGWMVGAGLARRRPDLFSRLVILNTNNLPDGEAELGRYSDPGTLARFLVLNSFFLFFRASMNLLRESFPLGLLVHSLNRRYSKSLVSAMTSPWPTKLHCGGTTAFPLMVPVTSSHPEAAGMRSIRRFLASWTRPSLVLYSQAALLPWLQDGDFVVGRRSEFYRRLVPGAVRVRAVGGQAGHLVMWDSPYTVVTEIREFMQRY